MNKNIIVGTIILLLLVIILIGYNVVKEKPASPSEPVSEAIPKPDIDEPKKAISISNNKGINEIIIDNITIKNVVVINENNLQQLEFTIESEQPLYNMIMEVALLNDTVVNKKMRFKYDKETYSDFIIMNFTNNYNNPTQIYFNIEKN